MKPFILLITVIALLVDTDALHMKTTRILSKRLSLQSSVLNPQIDLKMSATPSLSSLVPEPSMSVTIAHILDRIASFFPLWVLAASITGILRPAIFSWFTPFVTPALALTMLAMGMTLTISDFKRVLQAPIWVLVGFLSQYTVMPLSAFCLSRLFQLGPELSAGLILVGCAPGGTASNLVTLIAKADVALSILMTTCSTVAAVFMTPLLTKLLAGSYVSVSATQLVLSTLNVVLAPVLAGLVLNVKFPSICGEASKYSPFVSVALVSAICGGITATNRNVILSASVPKLPLLAAVVSLHSIGFLLGYTLPRFLGGSAQVSRTISIETGMQNSALAAVLARHFPNPAMSSIPGVVSATCHSVIGSVLAALWRRRDSEKAAQARNQPTYVM